MKPVLPTNLKKSPQMFLKSMLTSLCILLAFGLMAQPTVYTVDNRLQSGAQYQDVQAAIDAANAGDIIQVHPSPTAYTNFTINKTLTIIGLGHNPANADGTRAVVNTVALSGNAPNVLITGFAFAQLNSSLCTNCDGAKFINNRITWYFYGDNTVGTTDDWIIEGNFFEQTSNSLPVIQPYTGSSNWQIKNNFIRNFSINTANNTTIITNNIFIYTLSFTPNVFVQCTSPIVANNIFLYTNTSAVVSLSNSTIDFNKCLTYSYAGQTIADLPSSSTNFNNENPLFTNVPTNSETDFYNNDYSLSAGSPGKDAGTDATDLGLFGNNFAFDKNGRPDLTPYPVSMTISNTVVQPGQNLNVDFSAAIKQ